MITIKTDNHTFQVYSSIKELPIMRHKLMQQYLLQDSGIGSTIGDIDNRLSRLVNLLQAQKPDEAVEELSNLRYSFFSTLSGLDYKTRAFACFIYSIDGNPVTDLSSEGLTTLVGMFDEMSMEELESHWELVKKKLIPNSEPISPDGSEMTLNSLIV